MVSVIRVCILGQKNLYNEFVSYGIETQLGYEVKIEIDMEAFLEDIEVMKQMEDDGRPLILLIDIQAFSFEEIFKHVLMHIGQNNRFSLALFNLNKASGLEKKVISWKIKGFFYKTDSIEHFLKGMKCLLKGELWISREILSECLYENIEAKQTLIREKNDLTNREIEILSFIRLGMTNEEIAEKMFISMNTVKTHIYNVYKKINAVNRMQAVLWANEHL